MFCKKNEKKVTKLCTCTWGHVGLLNLAKCRSGKWKFFVSSKENILLYNWNLLQNRSKSLILLLTLRAKRATFISNILGAKIQITLFDWLSSNDRIWWNIFFFQIYSKRMKNPPFCRSFVLAVGHSDDAIKWLIFSGKWLHAHAVKRPEDRALPWCLYLSNHREKVCSCWTSRWRRLKARNYYCFHSWSTMTTKSWRRSEGSVMVRRVRSSKTKLSQWVARKNTRTINIRILISRKKSLKHFKL